MKKNIYLTVLFCLALALTVSAQKISKPMLTPSETTPAQKQLLSEGVRLHDSKQYDEAIKKYEQILRENPNSDEALYELSLSYYSNKDVPHALQAAYRLTQFRSNLGVLGYGMIANVLDDAGKPKEAIDIYRQAIKVLEDDPQLQSFVSNLYYNLGIAHYRQKQFKEAREASKKSVELNFSYPSANYLLAIIYHGTKYKVPALLAAARLISLEVNTQRTAQSTAIFLDIINGGKRDEKTGKITVPLDFAAPTDEGEFGMYEVLLGTLTTIKTDENKFKTANEVFADAVDTIISLLEEDKKLTSTFVGKIYIPFMVEMKKKGFSKPFAYLVLQQSGNREAESWLVNNKQQSVNFINWARAYELKK